MDNIFISYGREDSRQLAIRLRDDLLAVGYNVWLDLSEIAGGESWSENIERAIEECDIALALMSRASYASTWCRAEQMRAIRKGKHIIPILVQADAERPLHLEHINYLDFSKEERYGDMLRDLLSDINSDSAFNLSQQKTTKQDKKSPFAPRRRSSVPTRRPVGEKRNAPTFRRHLMKLRREDWLGSRYWWPYFLFNFATIQNVVDALTSGELASQFGQGGEFKTRWDKYVRLYFRPRTPNLYRAEGFRPVMNDQGGNYCPIPVYLLFDVDATICHPDSRFADGDPAKTGKTYKTPAQFGDLPFEQIYHDSWFMPDERDEIMRCREAQVIIPDKIGLESLQFIWVRSHAEYETLRNLLPPPIWRRWRDKVTARTDYNLFNRRWTYVDEVILMDKQARIHFNRCDLPSECGPFLLTTQVETADGKRYQWQHERFSAGADLQFDIPNATNGYKLEIKLDEDLAYRGMYEAGNAIF